MFHHPHIIRRGNARPAEPVQTALGSTELPVAESAEPRFIATGSWNGEPALAHDDIVFEIDASEQLPVAVEPAQPAPRNLPRARSRVGSHGDFTASAVIDVIVRVFARSSLSALVGSDALRSVLAGDSRALFPEPGVLELQPVWDLLESQPGFVADNAVAPMCRLKLLETRLQLDVILPFALGAYADEEACRKKAQDCRLADGEIERALGPATTVAITRIVETVTVVETAPAPRSRRTGLAVVAAVLGLVAAGVSADRTFNGGDPESDTLDQVEPSEISTDIPLLQARRSGTIIMGTLSDALWVLRPGTQRTHELEAAATKLRELGASQLVVIDTDGALAGSVVFEGGAAVVKIPAR